LRSGSIALNSLSPIGLDPRRSIPPRFQCPPRTFNVRVFRQATI
jgi:hypothetical protein